MLHILFVHIEQCKYTCRVPTVVVSTARERAPSSQRRAGLTTISGGASATFAGLALLIEVPILPPLGWEAGSNAAGEKKACAQSRACSKPVYRCIRSREPNHEESKTRRIRCNQSARARRGIKPCELPWRPPPFSPGGQGPSCHREGSGDTEGSPGRLPCDLFRWPKGKPEKWAS